MLAIGHAISPSFTRQTRWWDSLLLMSGTNVPLWMGTPETMTGLVGGLSDTWRGVLPTMPDAVASGAARPTRTATGLDLDGVGNFMTLAGLTSASTDYTFCVVCEPDTITGTQRLLGAAASESFSHAVAGMTSIHDGTAERAGMASTARLQMLTYVVKAGGTLWEFYRDGVLLATGATYDGTWAWGATPTLGAAHGGAAGWFDGELRFADIYPAALAAGDLATLHSVVAARFGLAFSPLSVALDAWWTFSAPHITLNGANVSQATDRYGGGRHLVQAVAARQPLAVLTGGPHGRGYVECDDAQQEWLRCATWGDVQPRTVIANILPSVSGDVNLSAWDGVAGNDCRLYAAVANRESLYAGGSLQHPTYDSRTWARIAAVYNGVDSSIAIDGGAPTTGNAGGNHPGGFTLGAYGNLAPNVGDPRVDEILIGGLLTAQEIAALVAWMAL